MKTRKLRLPKEYFQKVLLHDVISLRDEFLVFEQRIGIVSMTLAVSELSLLYVM